MTAETKPVDVLAVLALHARCQTNGRHDYPCLSARDELEQVRAAVAELIEATSALCGAVEFRIDDPRNAMRDRVVTALAIARGAP